MSRKSPRSAKTILIVKCEHCGVEFSAFRKSVRFCKPTCQAAAWTAHHDPHGRKDVLAKHGHACVRCIEPDPTARLFVRLDPKRGERVPVCGQHFSEISREKFYERVPDPGRGYASRIHLEKKIAQEAAQAES